MSWTGLAGMVRRGTLWLGEANQITAGGARHVMASPGGSGLVTARQARTGMASPGEVSPGKAGEVWKGHGMSDCGR